MGAKPKAVEARREATMADTIFMVNGSNKRVSGQAKRFCVFSLDWWRSVNNLLKSNSNTVAVKLQP